jgi:alkylation response protein AidB-like acyl-CoA dehydrogenase
MNAQPMHVAIDTCLRAPTDVPERASVAQWWPRWRDGAARAPDPAAMALLGGFDADRVGWAFAAGYQAALRALLPTLPADAMAAFCVTEEGGNRPRDIATRFTLAPGGGWTIHGAKRWTTLGPASNLLLVVGALPAEAADTRVQLRVARVPAGTPGLQLLPMPETRFVPEVPHARVQLDAVEVDADALLPGDGYQRYVKPFRTLEDAHVTLAVLAYLLREARQRGWPTGLAERLCATMAVLCDLAVAPADAASTHLVLAGALAQAHALYAEAGTLWAAAGDDPAALRWQRDAALFGVAGSARSQRTARAWERLQAGT